MEDICCGLRVGDEVPDFTLKTYDPAGKTFGEFGTKAQRDGKKWTILFFYPADFTFV